MLVSLGNPLVLGSASPRRFEILQQLAIPVRVLAPVGVDEQHHAGEAAQAFLQRVVDDKLRAVAARFDGGPGILVADTLVLVDEQILGKPNDLAHAQQMLAALAGRTHQVCTRYAISDGATPQLAKVARTVTTRVSFRDADPGELERYARTGEGMDKAGAYAVQGRGAFLVERIEGSYTNVVGLPACQVVADLRAVGLLGDYP